ncbi:MAG: FimB/Mfa2 family fimbrial subunit [Rikenellaceae bacterium]|nr:FimB/Mfa2 family fimbrial subunit [Rikenellaceae bacterium]
MKAIGTGFILILSFIALTGCVKDNRDDCPDDADRNLMLWFEYFDEEGDDIFAERIDMVDVVMFDRNYNFYDWRFVDKASLEEFQGVQLEVEPGDYHVICWANVSASRSEMPDDGSSSSLGQSVIHHSNTETADPLHYAPDRRESTAKKSRTRSGSLTGDGTWLLSVADKGTTEDTIAFMSAHRTLNVYLRNFPGMNDPEPVFPLVTIEHLAEYYDFTLGRGPENAYFVQTSYLMDVDEVTYCYAKFYIPHFDYDNDVNLVVTGQGQYTYSYVVPMHQILEINDIDSVYDGDDIVLDVEIIWEGDHFIQVKLPPFRVIEVKPEF